MDDLYAAVKDAVEIEPLALQEEFIRVPSDLAHWNERYAHTLRSYLLAKAEVKELEARLSLEYRETLEKPTERAIETSVDADSRMVEARLRLIEAEVAKVRTDGVLEAIRAKRDALVSLGAHIRAELQGDPSLRTQARGYREMHQNR